MVCKSKTYKVIKKKILKHRSILLLIWHALVATQYFSYLCGVGGVVVRVVPYNVQNFSSLSCLLI